MNHSLKFTISSVTGAHRIHLQQFSIQFLLDQVSLWKPAASLQSCNDQFSSTKSTSSINFVFLSCAAFFLFMFEIIAIHWHLRLCQPRRSVYLWWWWHWRGCRHSITDYKFAPGKDISSSNLFSPAIIGGRI